VTASTLAAALGAAGLPCAVEARAGLAVVTLASSSDAERLTDAELRRVVLAAAREHGFSHVALELVAGGGDADLPRA
jgi:hypothetical protein